MQRDEFEYRESDGRKGKIWEWIYTGKYRCECKEFDHRIQTASIEISITKGYLLF